MFALVKWLIVPLEFGFAGYDVTLYVNDLSGHGWSLILAGAMVGFGLLQIVLLIKTTDVR